MARRANGEGSVYQRKSDGLWVASVKLPLGKRVTRYGKTEKEALAKLRELVRQAESGINLANKQTVGEYLDWWLEHKRASDRVRPNTLTSYRNRLRHIRPYLGAMKLLSLKPQHILAAQRHMQEDDISESEIYHAHERLHQALSDAVKWDILLKAPTRATFPPRPEPRKKRAMSASDIVRVIDATREHRIGTLWPFLIGTGLRISEAICLRWSDIDWTNGAVKVTKSQEFVAGSELRDGPTKTRASVRTVFMSSGLTVMLRRQRSRQLEEQLSDALWQDHQLVFAGLHGKRMHRQEAGVILRDVMAELALPGYTLHEMRHTAGTLLHGRGVDLRVVQEIMGHASYQITADEYIHPTLDMRQQAASAIDDLFTREA